MPDLLRTAATLTALAATAVQAENRIDGQRPDAPALAAYGAQAIGVRTLSLTDPGRIDVLAVSNDAPRPDPMPVYDRPLTVEIWYPAAPGSEGDTTLSALLRDGRTEIALQGRAVRGAAPADDGPWPLAIVSHGYPGNRFLMSHLAENLASKGYVAVSIDHTDSTYSDRAAFGSTLVNRPLDQLFVLDAMAGLSGDPLAGQIDTDATAIIGYSMGGYGAVIAAGGGVTQSSVELSWGAPHGLLGRHLAGSDSHNALPDPRVKTIVAFGPWGRARDFWSAEGLSGIEVPVLYIAGSEDGVSGYEDGIRRMWEETTSTDRALLTYVNAGHNAGAPMPAPAEGRAVDPDLGFAPFEHYADPVWDSVRMNNIAQHFVTAWLDLQVRSDASRAPYLDLVADAQDGVWSVDADGAPAADHTYWEGFANGTAKGLRLEWRRAAE